MSPLATLQTTERLPARRWRWCKAWDMLRLVGIHYHLWVAGNACRSRFREGVLTLLCMYVVWVDRSTSLAGARLTSYAELRISYTAVVYTVQVPPTDVF